jgi:hypothetical protein
VHGRNIVASGSGVKQQWRDIGHANAPQQICVIPGRFPPVNAFLTINRAKIAE